MATVVHATEPDGLYCRGDYAGEGSVKTREHRLSCKTNPRLGEQIWKISMDVSDFGHFCIPVFDNLRVFVTCL